MITEKQGIIAPNFVVEANSFDYTISANSDYSGLVSMYKADYTFLAVVGYSITGDDSTNAVPVKVYKAGTSSLRYTIKNNSSSSRSQTLYVYGLYVKT